MSIGAVFTIIQYVVPAIKTAEQFFRGKGRGKEKKEAVVNGVLAHLSEALHQAKKTDLPSFDNYKWIELLAHSPEALDRVGDIIDAVVGLLNLLGEFEKDE